jgi:glycosyltransferase involved in cell wall biosynthesis
VDVSLSLIIPAWNEELLLPALLDSVDVARRAADPAAGAIEVIVADNASTDATAAIAAARGCRVVLVEKRVIGAVRNAGAAAARGSTLAFIDADSRIDPHTFAVIRAALASPAVVAGATGVTFDRWSPGLAATYALGAVLAWMSGLDAGVVFCRRADFLTVGGYSEERLFAEDVELLLDLKRLGRSRGQRLARPRGAKAITSTRKFDRHGDWHGLHLTARTIAVSLLEPLLGRRSRRAVVEQAARRYWYEDRVSPPSRPAAAPPGPPPAE